jgi:NitT/TauT family transport system substrate-binding protein
MTKKMVMFAIVCSMMFPLAAHADIYKIAIQAWTGFAPANVADVKGFWKSEGVNVKTVVIKNPQQALEMFREGRIHFIFDMIGTGIGMYMDGVPLVILAETDWSNGGDKLIVKKDLDARALKGKPIGVYYNKPSINYFLNKYLESINVKFSDIRPVEIELAELTEKFISGVFDIIVSYDPEALRAERGGNGKLAATSASYEGCIPEGMMALESSLEKIPQEDLKKIFRGWIKAVQWIEDPANWKEYMDILNNHTFKGDSPHPENDLKEMVGAVKLHPTATLYERNMAGGGLQTYLNELKLFLKANKMLTKDFDPDKIFQNKAIMGALEMQ